MPFSAFVLAQVQDDFDNMPEDAQNGEEGQIAEEMANYRRYADCVIGASNKGGEKCGYRGGIGIRLAS